MDDVRANMWTVVPSAMQKVSCDEIIGLPSPVSGFIASSGIKHGIPVTLKELSSSPMFKQGASLRVAGMLQSHSVDTAIAVISDGDASLTIDTDNLEDMVFCVGSIYQFIGELLIQPDNHATLQARVGRNMEGMNLDLYEQSLQLRRQFEAELLSSRKALFCFPESELSI